MIDNPVRSVRTQRRERALHDARERLARLEIEAHRIKAELARLKSENEDEIADELSDRLWPGGVDELYLAGPAIASPREPLRRLHFSPPHPPASGASAPPVVLADSNSTIGPEATFSTKPRRVLSPAWMLSLGVHLAILAVLMPMTFVVLTNERMPLLATMFDATSDSVDEPGAAPIELVNYEEFVPPDAAQDESAALAASLIEGPLPLESEFANQAASSLGQLNALPTDVGTLLAGGGGAGNDRATGGGRRGAASDEARLGTATFFGTSAKANRIVFVVDSSNSMKGGRLELALQELLSSIDQLSPKQSFYVIFVSDEAYPMFYPQPAVALLPATAPNKRQLREWMSRLILAGGVNRKMIEAMEIAAALNPEAVYLLWDGDMKYSDKVRQDVMTHLTRPNRWEFVIHTLGVGVKSLDSEHDLTAIASAHGGTYRPVMIAPGSRP